MGHIQQLYICSLTLLCLLWNLLPLVISICKQKESARQKRSPDEQSPLLQGLNQDQPILWGQSLNKKYKKGSFEEAIKNASIYALKGKIVALIGQNGAGKSTLLKLLHQNMKPDSGGLYHSKKRGEIRTALITDHSTPPSFCSLAHYSKLMSQYYILPNGSYSNYKALKDPQFQTLLTEKSKILETLNYALTIHPDVLLLDETLNSETKASLTKFLLSSQVREEAQIATIIATHDIEWTLQHSDYVCVLEKGKVLKFTPTKQLVSQLSNSVTIKLPIDKGSQLISSAIFQQMKHYSVQQSLSKMIIKCSLDSHCYKLLQELYKKRKIEKFDIQLTRGDSFSLYQSSSNQHNSYLSSKLIQSLLQTSKKSSWFSKFRALFLLQLSLFQKYILIFALCSLYFMDTLSPFYAHKFQHKFTRIVQFHLVRTSILILSIFSIQWIWYSREIPMSTPSFLHILTTSLVFSLAFITYVPPLSSTVLSNFIVQLFFYFLTVFHVTLWTIYFIAFAKRSRYPRFIFTLAIILVLCIKLNQRLYAFRWLSVLYITQISPFVNLANGPINYLLGVNLFLGPHEQYITGLTLLFFYLVIFDVLLIYCCKPNSSRLFSSLEKQILIGQERKRKVKPQNFIMYPECNKIQQQLNAMLPSFTPLQCMIYAAQYKGVLKKQAMRQIEALLQFFNLSRNRHKKMRELSLGEKKKVMIAMELIGSPSRLCFKNILHNLDRITQQRLEIFLLGFHKTQKAKNKMQIQIHESNFSTQFYQEFFEESRDLQNAQITTQLGLLFSESATEREKQQVVNSIAQKPEDNTA